MYSRYNQPHWIHAPDPRRIKSIARTNDSNRFNNKVSDNDFPYSRLPIFNLQRGFIGAESHRSAADIVDNSSSCRSSAFIFLFRFFFLFLSSFQSDQ
jgi:hypothetical protein